MKITKYIIIFGFLFFTSVAYAGVGVQPDSTELIVNAGQATTTGTLQVTNGPETAHVKVEAEDWLKKRTGVTIIPIEEWFTVSPVEFDMNPGETKSVNYTINVPQTAGAEVATMVYFATTDPQGALNITNRYGVSIYAAVSDKINIGCEIKSIDIDNVNNNKGIIFTLNLANKGNVHLRPTGNIVVTAEDGTKYDLKIARDFPIYVGSDLKQLVMWDKADIAPGNYKADITVDYGSLYKLDKKIEKTVSFSVNNDGTVSF